MPQLIFYFGSMNSGKTLKLLTINHALKSRGQRAFLIKPNIDNRDGIDIISSRIGISTKADLLIKPYVRKIYIKPEHKMVLVDEAQFLSESNVNALREVAKICPVICFGLRTDYRCKLFSGSKRLFEISDVIEEISCPALNMCKCGSKAIVNAKFFEAPCPGCRNDLPEFPPHRISGGCLSDQPKTSILIRDGSDEPDLGKEDKYKTLCWECWNENY